jgi:hypothetical protein
MANFTVVLNGTEIGQELADDMEDAAETLAALADNLAQADHEELVDHLDTYRSSKASLQQLAELILKAVGKMEP